MRTCSKCDSENLKKNGFDGKKQVWKCKDCGYSSVYVHQGPQRNDPPEDGNFKATENGNNLEVEIKISQIKTLDELVKICKIDLNIWKIDSHVVNKWDSTYQGKPLPLFQVKVSLTKRIPDVESFPAIKKVEINSTYSKPKNVARSSKGFKKALIFPDAQVGFRRDLKTGKLDPFHDRRCLDIGLQVAAEVRPDTIILLGDMLDLPEQSDKYLKSPEFYFTTQPSLIELAHWISQLRDICPDAEFVYLEGNHEFRMKRSLITNMIHSYNLKAYNSLNSYPALSIENLLSLEDMNVKYLGDYPNGEYWINDNLKVIHGDTAKNGSGETVKSVINSARSSIIQGHIHRIESACKTVHAKDKIISYRVDSFGCFCRIDGVVPAHHERSNWQQGFGIVEYQEGNGLFQVQPYSINDGVVLFNGELIKAREEFYMKKLIEDTKWEF